MALIDYDPLTGIFTWKERTVETEPDQRSRLIFNKLFGGREMGTINRISQSRVTRIGGKIYYAKALACLIMTGSYPKGRTAHLDGDHSNLRWDNIVSEKEGRLARLKRQEVVASTGDDGRVAAGVVYYGCDSAYRAFINLAFVSLSVGSYISLEAAIEARINKIQALGIAA